MATTKAVRPAPALDFLGERPGRRADAATLTAIFVVAQLIVPARLVLRGLPFSLTPADAVGLCMAVWWVFAHFTTSSGVAKGRNAVRTAMIGYVAAMVATYGYATYRFLPPDELNLADHSAVLVISTAGVTFLACDGLRTRERLDFVLKTVVVCGAIVSLIGAMQFAFQMDLTKIIKFPGLRFEGEQASIFDRWGQRRVAATTGHPIEFGVLCSMLLPIAGHYALRARNLGTPQLRWWFCCFAIASGLMFSVSRSAILGLAGAGLILFIGWPPHRRMRAAGVCLGFLVLVQLAVPGLIGTIYGQFANIGNDPSVKYRTHDYEVAANVIGNDFWLGRGLGTWYAPKHQVFDNQYILGMVETGFIGTVAFLAIFIAAAYACFRARRMTTDPQLRDLCVTLPACLVVPLIGQATFDLRSFAAVTGMTFLLFGVSGALLRVMREVNQQGGGAGPPTIQQLDPAR